MSTNFYMPTRICFGNNALKDIKKFINKSDKVLIITDEGLVSVGIVEMVTKEISSLGIEYEVYDSVEVNPRPQTVEKCLTQVKEMQASVIVGLGGGSPLDVAKIVSVLATNPGTLEEYQWEGKQMENPGLPFIAIATTAGTGSEVTRIAVIVDRNVKKGIVNDYLYPTVAIVDPALIRSLPPHLTSTTGLDALTHAIEAYVGLGANSFSDALAFEAIKLIGEYLPIAFANGDDMLAREQVAKASTLAGMAMDQAGLGMVHAMSSPVASYYDVPHGLANAVLLPHAMKFNVSAAPEKFASIAKFFGIDTSGLSSIEAAHEVVEKVRQFCLELKIPDKYYDYTPTQEEMELFGKEAAETFLARNNPIKLESEACVNIFNKVFVPCK
ncbi:MAG: hypothetical protein APF76_08555 [Desulfitibacter sp. BRH_c19]|nr:MAG: hypothetical protein APF76_08555 [Desulfitibacter sp. BRH_c19]